MSISSRTRSKVAFKIAVSRLINLPEEISDDIFLRLPGNSILSLRCVCKHFRSLFTKPSFIKNHVNRTIQGKNSNPKLLFNHYSLGNPPKIHSIPIDYASISSSSSLSSYLSCEFDAAVLFNYPLEFESESNKSYYMEFLGSCDGLICLQLNWDILKEDRYFSILNPFTRQFKAFKIPRYDTMCAYGFGYDSIIDDYKFVIIPNFVDWGCSYIDVYKVKSDSWSSIQGDFDYSISEGRGLGPTAVFLNGGLHWLGYKAILSFDISNEIMVHIPFPEKIMPPTDFWRPSGTHLGVWGDCICVAFILYIGRMDLWVMQEYGVDESWVNLFTTTQLPWPSDVLPIWKPLFCFDNGEFLVDYDGEELLLFDPISEKVRSVVLRDIIMNSRREIYVETIVSVGSSTYLERRITDGTLKKPKQQRLRRTSTVGRRKL